jgi:hypothetical protein
MQNKLIHIDNFELRSNNINEKLMNFQDAKAKARMKATYIYIVNLTKTGNKTQINAMQRILHALGYEYT